MAEQNEKQRSAWFKMRVTPEQRARIQRLAEQRGTSTRRAMLDLVDEALDDEDVEDAPVEPQPGSVYSLAHDIFENVGEGPPDLSINPKYMEDFGQS